MLKLNMIWMHISSFATTTCFTTVRFLFLRSFGENFFAVSLALSVWPDLWILLSHTAWETWFFSHKDFFPSLHIWSWVFWTGSWLEGILSVFFCPLHRKPLALKQRYGKPPVSQGCWICWLCWSIPFHLPLWNWKSDQQWIDYKTE